MSTIFASRIKMTFLLLSLLLATPNVFSQSMDIYEIIEMDNYDYVESDIAYYDGDLYMVGGYGGYDYGAEFNSLETPYFLDGYGSYLAKYKSDGIVEWAINIGDMFYEYQMDMDASGNIYISGQAGWETYIGDNAYLSDLTYGNDILLLKFDKDGNEIWVKTFGGPGNDDRVYDLTVGNDGSIYLTGNFSDTLAFSSSVELTTTADNDYDAFIVKLDSDGNAIWAESIGYEDGDKGAGIATDADNNVLVTGYYSNKLFTTAGDLTSAGSSDIFLAKYDSDGTLLWINSAGGTDGDAGVEAIMDSKGNCIISGYFFNTADFGGTTINSNYKWDIFVAKYDADGNFLWVRNGGGDGYTVEQPTDIEVNSNDGIVVCGYTMGNGNFGALNISSGGPGTRMFLIKYSPGGTESWIKRGYVSSRKLYGVELDDYSEVFVSGQQDGYDAFLFSYIDNTIGIESIEADGSIITALNNTVVINGKGNVTIYTLSGQLVYQEEFKGTTSITLDGAVYLVKVQNDGKEVVKKVYLVE
ncbi:MAG: T9SS type A sorting domain-containing protein [Flavobacteriales bacterium]|nr:T9SS type A sorting domain-containing protein [Flavobacteriales bacterium]